MRARVDLTKVKSPAEWHTGRRKIESTIFAVLESLPKERAELQVKTIDEVQFPGYVRRRVNYFVDEWERISAWLFVPHCEEEVPAILCCHQRVPQGKDEPAGVEGDPHLAFAQHYAKLGYVTLAPDCITAGERVSVGLEPFDTKSFYKDHPRMSAMGKMVWDHIHAIDLLCEVRGVDSARMGVVGHSLGAYNALFLVALDERVQACVASCGFTRFAADPEPQRWADDRGFVHFPKLRDAIKRKKFPFDWEHILALCAPSPTLVITALNDSVVLNTASCDKAHRDAGKIYELLGAPDALCHHMHRDGHCVTPETLQMADEWFERWL